MNLILANENDITIGEPVPWALYDPQHGLLLNQGSVVPDHACRDDLLARGACYERGGEEPRNENSDSFFAAKPNSEPLKREEGDTRFTFDDMGLKAESRLQLSPPPQLSHERFPVWVIGFLRDQILLITTPVEANGIPLPLLEGEVVVMRSFSGLNAFAFASTIERVCKLPYEYLHLSFPDVIEGIVIRKVPRVKTNINATVKNSTARDSGESISACIADIGANGAALDAKYRLGSEGDTLNLAFRVHLHNVDALLSIKGLIRAVFSCQTTETVEPDLVRHGIEFQDMQPNDSIILESMIYQQLIENPHLLV